MAKERTGATQSEVSSWGLPCLLRCKLENGSAVVAGTISMVAGVQTEELTLGDRSRHGDSHKPARHCGTGSRCLQQAAWRWPHLAQDKHVSVQAPSCRRTSLQQPPCLLTVADWVEAVAAAGMQPWRVTPGRAYCLYGACCLALGHGQL